MDPHTWHKDQANVKQQMYLIWLHLIKTTDTIPDTSGEKRIFRLDNGPRLVLEEPGMSLCCSSIREHRLEDGWTQLFVAWRDNTLGV